MSGLVPLKAGAAPAQLKPAMIDAATKIVLRISYPPYRLAAPISAIDRSGRRIYHSNVGDGARPPFAGIACARALFRGRK
jgi:hypothetical protein